MRPVNRMIAMLSCAVAAASCSPRAGAPAEAPEQKPCPEPAAQDTQPQEWTLDRTVLPIHMPPRPTFKELDVRDTKPPATFQVAAPKDAPNVVVVLIDDLGFGVTSTFGGPVETPQLDALAEQGLRFNNFHTTALCSPTRIALKSGRNHHMAEAGSIMETSTAYPGNTGRIPDRVAPLAEVLRLNGYSTAAFGKWHETAVWETSVSGPFDRWPLHQGFDSFYGFIGGETNQWAPGLFDGATRVEPPEDQPEYHFLTDMTDRTIQWMKAQQSMTPDKPFFVYYAPGAVHAPHHVPKDWIAKYKGKFDQGWDKLREETLQRQIKLGIVPPDTKLPPKPAAIKDWDKLSPVEKKVFARQAEVYAAFVAMTDYEAGRVLQAVEDMGETDNTLVIFIAGDNGTSAEGGAVGLFNEMTYFNGVSENIDELAKKIDEWGGPTTFPHMASGWAVALDSPHKWTKQIASDFGGTRNAMVMSWPKNIKKTGELRTQFHHVIDVAQTVLEAAQLPEPTTVHGVEQIPMQGVSMLYAAQDAQAADRHTTQYFEIIGNRAIYHDGWLARVIHKAPWEDKPRQSLAEDKWELFHVTQDFSLATDLASTEPARLKEMQALFMHEAEINHVLPVDDRSIERFDAKIAGRPDLMEGRKSLTVYPGMTGMFENAFISIKNSSFTIEAVIEPGKQAPHGMILAQGGRFGGWALYAKNGKPGFTYNFLGLQRFTVMSKKAVGLSKDPVKLRFSFEYDGGRGAGGKGTLYINDEKVAEGRIEKTQANVFSLDETADVGIDLATPVVEDFGEGSATSFRGKIDHVTVELVAKP